MQPTQLTWITNFIWGIANDVPGDTFHSKYRGAIWHLTVLRRLDTVPEDTKHAVLDLDMKAALDGAGVVEQDAALRPSEVGCHRGDGTEISR